MKLKLKLRFQQKAIYDNHKLIMLIIKPIFEKVKKKLRKFAIPNLVAVVSSTSQI